MIRSKKKAGLVAMLLSASLTLGSCGTNTIKNYQESQEITATLTFFGNKYEPENVTVIEKIISGFMKENPNIRVSYESLKGTDYYDALQKRMASGKGDDVFMVNHDIVLELTARGQLLDLSGLETLSDYTDQMLGQMVENGKIYWIPTTVSVFGLYCNKDLLKKYEQKTPENLQEWESVCSYFKEKGITPIIANNDISLKTLAIGLGFFELYQNNGQAEAFERLNDGTDRLSDYLEPGFALAERFIEKGYIDAEKALETRKTSDDLTEFVKGEAPFMLTGAWAAGRVEGLNPEFAFEVVPYPILEDGSLEVINADTRLSANADSEYKDESLKFIEYFTREENIKMFADQQSSFSPLKGGSPSSVREVSPLIPCYQSGQIVIGTDGQLDLPIWNLTAEVSKKLLQGEPLQDAMEWMDRQIEVERGES